jgi:hypothetical protein
LKTSSITIKVPEELRFKFKMVALKKKVTMTEIIISCIEKTVNEYEHKNTKQHIKR